MSDDPTAPSAWPFLAARVAGWLPGTRWFGDKGSAGGRLTILDCARLPFGAALLLVANAADGRGRRWFVPVDPATGADAGGRADVAAWLVDAMLEGGEAPGVHGRFVGRGVGAPHPGRGWHAVGCHPLGADASNTSLRLDLGDGGDGLMAVALKLLRRAPGGTNPEVEVGRFFVESTDWRGTPPLLGHLDYEPAAAFGEDAGPTTVATLHRFQPGSRSAWDHGLDLVGRSDAGAGALLPFAGLLGRTTAAMHAALASRPDIPAFAPRRSTVATRLDLVASLLRHARRAIDRVAAADVPAGLRPRLASLARRQGTIEAILRRPAEFPRGAADIRVHGDYHLGQVLVDAEGGRAMPIDFEGEPARSLAERRAVTSAAKDVAGMGRSFDYLLRQAARGRGGVPEDSAPLVAAFVDAYRESAGRAAWWPEDRDEEGVLLAAFTLDKALYELAYEVDNRPDWIGVPLDALESILSVADG